MMCDALKKIPWGKVVGRTFLYLFLIALGIILLIPFVFMINRGLMTNERFTDTVMHYFPDKLEFSNFVNAFKEGSYGLPLVNSLWLCVLNAVAVPFVSLLPAYAFAKLEWIGKKFVFAFMMFTAMLPSIVTQVPLYVLYNDLGMLNTFLPLFLPSLLFTGAMNVFLTRQFLLGQPKELEESAIIDGANPFVRFITISAPLCKPILMYLGITTFISTWGDYYTPSIYITSEDAQRTFALELYNATWSQTNIAHPEWIFTAATVLTMVPAVLFAFFQKYLVQGIATAGIKG